MNSLRLGSSQADVGHSATSLPLRVAEVLRASQEVLQNLNAITQSTGLITTEDRFRYREGSDFEEFVDSLRVAEDNLSSAVRNIHNAVLIVDRAHEFSPQTSLQRPLVRRGSDALGKSISCFHSCEGPIFTTCLVEASASPSAKVEVRPDCDFSNIHKDIRPIIASVFSKTIPGPQSFLLPLLSTDECSVAVDRDLAVPGNDGFTVSVIFCLVSKLLWSYEKHRTPFKAVFVSRLPKAEHVRDLLCLLPPQIHCVNLLSGERPAPPSESHPRLVVCSAKDFLESNAIRTDDIDHLVIDDCNEATQQIFANNRFCKLRDVVYRGPAAALRQLPSPLSAKYHARLWSSERTVNVFDVQPFTMAKQIEELFASFPPGRNYLLTTQTNVFLQNVTVVATLDALPEDVDHLVVMDLPLSMTEVVEMLKKAAARVITLVIVPPTSKHLILQALEVEGIRRVRSSLSSSIEPAVRY